MLPRLSWARACRRALCRQLLGWHARSSTLATLLASPTHLALLLGARGLRLVLPKGLLSLCSILLLRLFLGLLALLLLHLRRALFAASLTSACLLPFALLLARGQLPGASRGSRCGLRLGSGPCAWRARGGECRRRRRPRR